MPSVPNSYQSKRSSTALPPVIQGRGKGKILSGGGSKISSGGGKVGGKSLKSLKFPLKKPKNFTARAGLTFPVSRVRRNLKNSAVRGPGGRSGKGMRVATGAPIFLASVLEYCMAEVLELAGHACKDFKKKRITPQHINLAIRNDPELDRLLKHCVFAEAGVVPFIHPVLLPRRKPGEDDD